MKHWILWRLSPSYRARISAEWDARLEGFWKAGAEAHLSRTEAGRAALRARHRSDRP